MSDTPEGIANVMKAFGKWFEEFGPALVARGKPIGRIMRAVRPRSKAMDWFDGSLR